MKKLALIPLAFFAYAVVVNAVDHTLWTVLWLCNVCNLVLAAGYALAWPRAVWIATLWLVLSMPIWFIDAWFRSGFEVHSFLTHIAAPIVGLATLRRLPRPRGLWWQALLFLAALQLVTRAVLSPAGNVNAAFETYAPFARLVPSYPLYWLANTAAFAVALVVLERMLAAWCSSSPP